MTEVEKGGINEMRKDVFGRKVVITTVRKARPHDVGAVPQKPQRVTSPQNCFFCPGNEQLTPPEIDRIEKDGKWEIRCFPNKFPAFSPESKKAYGRHEMIVETPDHYKTMSELSEENIYDCLVMIKRRMQSAMQDSKLKYTLAFKNEGKTAGASLEHTHIQLVSMDFVPDYIKKLGKKTAKFSKLQKKERKNIFAENDLFFAFCPKASRFHFESWIVPKGKISSLTEMDENVLRQLAAILKSVMAAIDRATSYAPYNIVFHSAPHEGGEFPFHIQIMPRIATWAGFEIGTEIVLLSQLPEESAAVLSKFVKEQSV